MNTHTQAASYEVGTQGGMHPEDQPETTSDRSKAGKVVRGVASPVLLAEAPVRRRDATWRLLPEDEEERGIDKGYDTYTSSLPNSSRIYAPMPTRTAAQSVIRVTHHHGVPPRSHAAQQTLSRPRQPQQQARRVAHSRPAHRPPWLGFVGLVFIVMVMGWLVLCLLLACWQGMQDDWLYGRPRTFQVDQVVGGDSAASPTHFVALNMHGHLSLIEIHGSDPNKTSMISEPATIGPLDPVTLHFKDVNHDGKLDLLIQVRSSLYVFINDGNGTFRPVTPSDKISL